MSNRGTDIVFIGGDMRMIYAAKSLSERRKCALYGFDRLDADKRTGAELHVSGRRYDIAVLPVLNGGIRCPFGEHDVSIAELPGLLNDGAVIFAGRVTEQLAGLCAEKGYELYDYLAREELAVLNAVPTAEGAVGIAIRETDRTVHGADVLILGFGRIGKLTARYFACLGASVTAAARKKSDLAWISACGYDAADFSDEEKLTRAISRADIIINTVPSAVLTGAREKAVRRGAVVIELASSPCTAEGSGLRIIAAGGLPGRTAPVTAGEIIADTIVNILTERSMANGAA